MSAKQMSTPDRSTAAAFPRYLTGEVVADSVALQWPGLYARRWRHPRVVDRFLVPATPEPHISGMTPLQFVTRQRITRAQQLIRETSRSLIDVGLEVGYTSPSHFAQVFRRVVGVTPTEFRSSL